MKYGFIGCGNMGSALIRAVAKQTKDIMIADYDNEKAISLANELGLVSSDNQTIAKECDRIFLGVKPQVMAEMLTDIKEILNDKKPTLISMAAGLTTKKIKELAGDMPVIRIMPNTPVSVGDGVILYCASGVENETVTDFVNDMKYSGKLYSIDESLMDAGCSVSGCGPAFMYTFASAVAKGGEECGLDKARTDRARTALKAHRSVKNGAGKFRAADLAVIGIAHTADHTGVYGRKHIVKGTALAFYVARIHTETQIFFALPYRKNLLARKLEGGKLSTVLG